MKDVYTNYPRTLLWLVRGGTIAIGGPEPDAQPGFQIEIPSFYISKFPITNEQYEAFDRTHRRSVNSPGNRDPAVGLSFVQACAYCAWYAKLAKKSFRLPSELEWEYAARAGCEDPVPFEDRDQADAHVWHAGNSSAVVPDLEAKKPNGFGLFGMLGGVWDWTASVYRPYPLDPETETTGTGPRVIRGGSYRSSLEKISYSLRGCLDPDEKREDVGFRLVKRFG